MIDLKELDFKSLYKEIIPNTSYLTHGIHSYTAKLIPQMPRYLIEKYSEKNDYILDPFCGSGTTLLESKILNRNAFGIDLNPLSSLISEVKTNLIDIDQTKKAINYIDSQLKKEKVGIPVDFTNINYWFSTKAQSELSKIRFVIQKSKSKFGEDIFKFLQVCFSSIIRKSSYADNHMAKTYKSKRVVKQINNGWEPTPILYFKESMHKNLNCMISLKEKIKSSDNFVRTFQGNAKSTSEILNINSIKKIDLVVTSPPYINAQDYFRSYKLELWWLGLLTPKEVISLNKKAIGTENITGTEYKQKPTSEFDKLNKITTKIWEKNEKKGHIVNNYFLDMKHVFSELFTILDEEGKFCLVTGNNNVCEESIKTYELLGHIAQNIGFVPVELIRDEIKKRNLFTNRNHNGGVIKEEWITIFEKNGE